MVVDTRYSRRLAQKLADSLSAHLPKCLIGLVAGYMRDGDVDALIAMLASQNGTHRRYGDPWHWLSITLHLGNRREYIALRMVNDRQTVALRVDLAGMSAMLASGRERVTDVLDRMIARVELSSPFRYTWRVGMLADWLIAAFNTARAAGRPPAQVEN